ncbi:MAG: UbiA family prenyltransferase, partial [Lacipirellulaceae bacterium]
MLKTARHFLSLIRFSHTIFALPFALLAAVMAWRLRSLESATVEFVEGIRLTIFGMTLDLGGFELSKLQIRPQELLGILLCMVTARSAAMAFNRLVDRKIDAGNPRTSGRHLPAGILSTTQVTIFTTFTSLAFIASTLLFLPNRLPLYLSVPVLLFLFGYSLTKRFTSLAHF